MDAVLWRTSSISHAGAEEGRPCTLPGQYGGAGPDGVGVGELTLRVYVGES